MIDLAELLSRVREAKGPDQKLDDDLFWFLVPPESVKTMRDGTRYVTGQIVGDYTSSIDAALVLVERTLPGQWWLVLEDATTRLWNSEHREDELKMLPIFLIQSLLSALQSESLPQEVTDAIAEK